MKTRGRPRHPDVLTPREFEVLALLREGLSNPEIAGRLGISRDGVKYHVSEILGKLDLSSREEAAGWRAEAYRPWWAGAVAPLALVWRKAGLAVAGAVPVVAIGGLAFLAFLLLTGEDGGGAPLSTPQLAYFDAEDGALWLADTEGVQRKLADDGSCDPYSLPAWSPSGELISCYSISADGMVIRDAAGAVINQIDMLGVQNVSCCGASLDWSPDGTAILYSYDEEGGATHFAVAGTSDGASHDLGPIDTSLTFGAPPWSPDGSRIAYRDAVSGSTFIYDFETQSASELEGDYYPLAWALGGSALLVATNVEGLPFPECCNDETRARYARYEANLLDLDTGSLTRVPQLDNGVGFWVAPGGERVAYRTRGLSLLDLRAGEATAIDDSVINSQSGPMIWPARVQFSPDGAYLAWAGGQELYRARTDGSELTKLLELDTPSPPFFILAPDFEHIAYGEQVSGDTKLYLASIDGSDPIEVASVPGDATVLHIFPAWRPTTSGTSD